MKVKAVNTHSKPKPQKTSNNALSFTIDGLDFRKLSDNDKKTFYNSFEVLLNSGIDIKNALDLLIAQNSSKKWKRILSQIYDGIISGKSLSEAMADSKVFTDYELSSIKIGEETGFLNQIISQLNKHFEEKLKLKRLIISTFSYPLLVMLLTTGTLYFMLSYIVPMFENIFKRFNKELPELTLFIIKLSNWVSSNAIWFLFTISGILIIHLLLARSNTYKMKMGKFILLLPLFGKTVSKTYLTRFTMAMSFLSKSGSSLVHSLDLTSRMVDFYPLEFAITKVKEDVIQGESLATSLSKFSIFPATFVSLIKIAENVNQLDNMFEKISDQYQKDLEHQTKVVSRVLEPLIIMVVATIVGVILIALYLPLFNLSNVM